MDMIGRLERISRFDPGRGTPDAWLAGIARMKAQEMGRGQPVAVMDIDAMDPAAPPGREGPVDGDLVGLALDRLEPRHAEVLRRKYIGGESIETIAGALGLKAATVGTLLHRGRERFKESYERLLARTRRETRKI